MLTTDIGVVSVAAAVFVPERAHLQASDVHTTVVYRAYIAASGMTMYVGPVYVILPPSTTCMHVIPGSRYQFNHSSKTTYAGEQSMEKEQKTTRKMRKNSFPVPPRSRDIRQYIARYCQNVLGEVVLPLYVARKLAIRT